MAGRLMHKWGCEEQITLGLGPEFIHDLSLGKRPLSPGRIKLQIAYRVE